MKHLALTVLLLLALAAKSQTITTPATNDVDVKWITPGSYKIQWLLQKDTLKRIIGTIETTLVKSDDQVIIAQRVMLQSSTEPWVDSTIAAYPTLKPIYHSSYNAQRDMILKYSSDTISGYYHDKIRKTETTTFDKNSGAFFDSNLSTFLVAWLPLKDDYKTSIPIYNFGSPTDYGIKAIQINDTYEGTYKTPGGKMVDVFILEVHDDISQATSLYYIGKKDRVTYEITIPSKNGSMRLIRTE